MIPDLFTSAITVWGYSHRTISSFETLVLDFVRQFNRSLSGHSLQTLIIWGLIGAGGSVLFVRYVPIMIQRLEWSIKRNVPMGVVAFLAFGLLSSLISGLTVGLTMNQALTDRLSPRSSPVVAGVQTAPESTSPPVVRQASDQPTIDVLTIFSPGTRVNLREFPSEEARIIYKLNDQDPVVKLEDEGSWVHVGLIGPSDEIIEGWVYEDFVIKQ